MSRLDVLCMIEGSGCTCQLHIGLVQVRILRGWLVARRMDAFSVAKADITEVATARCNTSCG